MIPKEDNVVEAKLPPHDSDAEQALVATVVFDESTEKIRHLLKPEHIYTEAYRRIFLAAIEIESAGETPDVLAIISHLSDSGSLQRVGGKGAIVDLLSVPTVSHPEEYARRVRDKYALRRTIDIARRIAAEGYSATDADEFVAKSTEEFAEIAGETNRKTPPSLKWPSPAERVDRMRSPATRHPLGIEPLDRACRGGLSAGRIIVFVAQPGGAKTMLAVQIGEHLRASGAFVAIAAYDEEAESLLVRIGQGQGLEREALENADPHSIAQLRAHVDSPAWLLVDGSGDDSTELGYIIDELCSRATSADKTPVLVLDSIQTAFVPSDRDDDSARSKVDRTIRLLKLARARGVIIVCTSEANRAFYRTRDGRINALAAAKESGSIEYQASVMVVLDVFDSDDGTDDRVACYIPKNRVGNKVKHPFWLRIDKATSTLAPCPAPEEYEQEQVKRAGGATSKPRFNDCRLRTEKYISNNPGSTTKVLREAVKEDGFGNGTVAASIEWLESAGRIERKIVDSERRGAATPVHWHLTDFARENPLREDS